VYDSVRDVVDSYDFSTIHHFPVSHYWDPVEPKLLACETHRMRTAYAQAHPAGNPDRTGNVEIRSNTLRQTAEAASLVEVATLFVTTEHGILLQDAFALEPPLQAFLGVQAPRLFFTRHASNTAATKSSVRTSSGNCGVDEPASVVGMCGRVMRDFIGLDDADAKTRSALLDFSFFLTVGNMDEAHCAVRLIRSPSVWENMAHMCVKTKRLDVAEVCLGHMGHARGAAAVRAAKTKAMEPEAGVAAACPRAAKNF